MPKKLTSEKFVYRATLLHNRKYGYSLANYNGNKIPIKILCPHHGEFIQRPDSHLNGNGCRKCYDKANGDRKRKSLSVFIEQASKLHNNFYDYSKVIYKTALGKVKISCPLHGEFYQRPNDHLNGKGCLYCSLERTTSREETEFLDYIDIPKECRNRYIYPYNVDAYIPASKTIYEFLGDYWHGNPQKYSPNKLNKHCLRSFRSLYSETFDRLYYLKNKGYCVKYIWESDWKKFQRGRTSHIAIKEL